MTTLFEPPLQKLQFYATTAYQCGYLKDQRAQSLIAAPHHLISTEIYSGLIQQGFRRSGKFAYRPHCEHCNACIAVRVPVQTFKPSRSQKRALKQHDHLRVQMRPLQFQQAHFELYLAYQIARHDVEDDEAKNLEEYRNFLTQSNIESYLLEFLEDDQLKMVSVVDVVNDGVSAVYTFYDTTNAKASYGTYNVLWQIEWAKRLGLPFLYLGYWIAASPKMAYKQLFQPQQKLIDGEWL